MEQAANHIWIRLARIFTNHHVICNVTLQPNKCCSNLWITLNICDMTRAYQSFREMFHFSGYIPMMIFIHPCINHIYPRFWVWRFGKRNQYVNYMIKYGKSINKLNILIYFQSEYIQSGWNMWCYPSVTIHMYSTPANGFVTCNIPHHYNWGNLWHAFQVTLAPCSIWTKCFITANMP